MRSHILAVLVGALLLAVPAYAENTVRPRRFKRN